MNKKKVHRLWREEGLQVRVHSPRKRAGVSSIPPIEADAPNVLSVTDCSVCKAVTHVSWIWENHVGNGVICSGVTDVCGLRTEGRLCWLTRGPWVWGPLRRAVGDWPRRRG